jgi:hypothetical protein
VFSPLGADNDDDDDDDDDGFGSLSTNTPASAIFDEASPRPSQMRKHSQRVPTPHTQQSPGISTMGGSFRHVEDHYDSSSSSDRDSDAEAEEDDQSSLMRDLDRVKHERQQRERQQSHGSHSQTRSARTRTPSHGSRARNNSAYSVGSLLKRTKSVSMMKADDIMRLLSMAGREPGAFLVPQLLTYVRAIFLEILRVRYWHDIERGKIPRQSHSAKFLLYSVEVGVDEVEQDPGARDWIVIHKEITVQPLSIRMLSYLDATLPGTYGTYYLGKLEARREKRAVYMLHSFIDAHEHAQKKVHEFIADDEDDEDKVQSPEELKVIEESKQAVSTLPMKCLKKHICKSKII